MKHPRLATHLTILLGRFLKHPPALTVLAFILISFLVPAVQATTKKGGFSIGITTGYAPNVFNLASSGEELNGQNTRILNQVSQVNDLYKNQDGKPVLRDFKYEGGSLNAMPVEFSMRFTWKGFFVRTGVAHYNVFGDTKSYVSTTGPGTTRRYPGDGSNLLLYEDIQDLYDADPTNDLSLAKGLRPGYSNSVKYTQTYTGEQFEVPLTLGISMFDLGPCSFYFGGGITWFNAKKTRIISAEILDSDQSNAEFFQDDIDRYVANSIGFHLATGGEFRISERIGLIFDLIFNFGSSGALKDNFRTGAFTNNTLFHKNDDLDRGGNEKRSERDKEQVGNSFPFSDGVEGTSAIDFRGYRAMIGLNYYLSLL